ncbi:MAG: AGE family epimerase/isomerase [Pseudomonadota bacterium]
MTALSIAGRQPGIHASAETWVTWYWSDLLPAWVEHAMDPAGQGFVDALGPDGQPQEPQRRSVLAQARLLYTFAHLARISDRPVYRAAARRAFDALPAFRKSNGLYARARQANGDPTDQAPDALATSYDQSFVILGLITWADLAQDTESAAATDACWEAIDSNLVDPATGLLLEHDGLKNPAEPTAPPRAQNPHMHLYEAALQACEMTGDRAWLDRAGALRAKALAHFWDAESGSIMEFRAPDLSLLPGRDGQRREVGHQCEWAWLLAREVQLGGDPALRDTAERLLNFADRFGFATDAPLAGAAFDAVAADGSWSEPTFLLWPQTEAIKAHAIRAGRGDFAKRGRDLAQLMFRYYFAGRRVFANQLDATGAPLWPDALSRLHYHLVLALTEGARAGMWRDPD